MLSYYEQDMNTEDPVERCHKDLKNFVAKQTVKQDRQALFKYRLNITEDMSEKEINRERLRFHLNQKKEERKRK